VAIAIALAIYLDEALREEPLPTTIKTTTEVTTTEETTTTSESTTTEPTLPSSTRTARPTTTLVVTTTTTTEPTTTTIPYHIQRYGGKGYRLTYLDITFMCPTCVPAVSANLRNTDGYIAKSMSYRQHLSWIIYDSERVSLEKIIQIAGANGEAVFINDTEI
jgi:hypothetical protein